MSAHALLRADSALVEIWPDRLAPMFSRRSIPLFLGGVYFQDFGYNLRVDLLTITQLERLIAILPEAPDLAILRALGEVWVSANHIEAIR